MRKSLLLAPLFMTFAVGAMAQPVPSEGSVEYQKGDKRAAIIELPYKPAVVEDAIKEHMAKMGYREDKTKGFQVYKGARLSPSDPELADLYFKVDRKGRQDKDISVVYLIVGHPNENVALKAGDDVSKIEDGKSFLTSLIPSVESHSLEVSISEQDETIKKAEKKLRNLQDDQKDYEKKMRSLEDKLAENKRDQESQNAEVSKQRAVRDAMISRRK